MLFVGLEETSVIVHAFVRGFSVLLVARCAAMNQTEKTTAFSKPTDQWRSSEQDEQVQSPCWSARR